MNALVTGASGFVGSHLVRALLARGDAVRVLARSASGGAALKAAGAEVWVGDLAQPDRIDGLADGLDVVFHLASAMSGSADRFERVDLEGTRRLLRMAAEAGVRRFVYPGTLSAHPLAQLPDGAVIDERCPLDDTGLLGNYARAKRRAEEVVLAAHQRREIEVVIVRLGLVCGVGTSLFPPHVCHVVGPGRVVLFGDGMVPLPLTFIDNAVDALVLGATRPGIGGEIFHIVDDDVLTQAEYLALLRQCTGSNLHILRLPRAAYYALGWLAEMVAKLRDQEAATNRHRVRARLRHVRWDCTKAKRVLHWCPRVPLRKGLSDSFRAQAALTAKS